MQAKEKKPKVNAPNASVPPIDRKHTKHKAPSPVRPLTHAALRCFRSVINPPPRYLPR